jgi:hypothetical protein
MPRLRSFVNSIITIINLYTVNKNIPKIHIPDISTVNNMMGGMQENGLSERTHFKWSKGNPINKI